MADSTAKLPFILSMKWSVQWTIAVALRHQVAVATYMAGGVLLSLLFMGEPMLVGLGWIVLGVASIALALVTHNEVLCGPSGFNAAILGQSGGRIFSYFLDCMVLGVLIFLIILIPTFLVILIASVESAEGSAMVWGGIILITSIIGLVITSRLALRLPSRAIGMPMAWGDVWRLGAGHTLVLVLAPVLLSIPLAVVSGLAEGLVSQAFGDAVHMVLMPLQVVLTCSFLSVAYGRLRALATV